MKSKHLKDLEAASIRIFREVASEFERPVLLYSGGKDSSVLLHVAAKAFYPSQITFPVLHVDATWKFREMNAFRDATSARLGIQLIVHSNEAVRSAGATPFEHDSNGCTDVMTTPALLHALDAGKFDAAIGGARRDDEISRASERVLSHWTADHRCVQSHQRPELWNLYNCHLAPGENMRVSPLSDWTELDVWQYIKTEDIPIASLYFAADRPVVERDGKIFMVDDDRVPLKQGETLRNERVRCRSLGDYPLTGAVRSNAQSVDEIIAELLGSRVSGGRAG